MPNVAANLEGKIFGRLTVIGRIGSRHNKSLWRCKCRCGNFTEVISICLTRGKAKGNRVGGTKSCGSCFDSYKYPKEYRAWIDMLQRCLNKTNQAYSYYGERGITVCDRWRDDFLNFLDDMGKAPDPGLSLDRVNNNGNYEKGNCVWATWSEQMLNRRFHNQFDH